ncbi:class I SAM-dependent methyltransferase [Sciscionella sediminilitoris]|uniref:class I SAM-dependent methyltransferase n=1 Tax=Sciscionella sediminilitoris TaxID=1445613 RepID=UPI001E4C14EC|nr:class I SAM-dependent methyltransferase [Sciscionella sp. SE31]
MVAVTGAEIRRLYPEYAEDLHRVRAEQREFLAANGKGFTAQLDDIEAEITYLLLRARRPELVVELGTLHGWSTTWILRALRDNGTGMLRSHDIAERVRETVPAELRGNWEFRPGDARETMPELPERTEYLFIDADHGARFARWYVRALLEPCSWPMNVSVHDVFHWRFAKPLSEGRVVLDWLDTRRQPWFTAARAKARGEFDALCALRAELGFTEDIKASKANPMLYFALS